MLGRRSQNAYKNTPFERPPPVFMTQSIHTLKGGTRTLVARAHSHMHSSGSGNHNGLDLVDHKCRNRFFVFLHILEEEETSWENKNGIKLHVSSLTRVSNCNRAFWYFNDVVSCWKFTHSQCESGVKSRTQCAFCRHQSFGFFFFLWSNLGLPAAERSLMTPMKTVFIQSQHSEGVLIHACNTESSHYLIHKKKALRTS